MFFFSRFLVVFLLFFGGDVAFLGVISRFWGYFRAMRPLFRAQREIFFELIFRNGAEQNGGLPPWASVGINVDATGVVYAPAPGDTRSGFVTIRLVAQVTESAQLNSKKVWASHPLGRTEAVALPDIGIFTIGGVTNVEMARLPFGGAGYSTAALHLACQTHARVGVGVRGKRGPSCVIPRRPSTILGPSLGNVTAPVTMVQSDF